MTARDVSVSTLWAVMGPPLQHLCRFECCTKIAQIFIVNREAGWYT